VIRPLLSVLAFSIRQFRAACAMGVGGYAYWPGSGGFFGEGSARRERASRFARSRLSILVSNQDVPGLRRGSSEIGPSGG